MLTDFLEVGGVEVVNAARLRGYLRSKQCPSYAVEGEPCSGLREALGAVAEPVIEDAPMIINLVTAPNGNQGWLAYGGASGEVVGDAFEVVSSGTGGVEIPPYNIDETGYVGWPAYAYIEVFLPVGVQGLVEVVSWNRSGAPDYVTVASEQVTGSGRWQTVRILNVSPVISKMVGFHVSTSGAATFQVRHAIIGQIFQGARPPASFWDADTPDTTRRVYLDFDGNAFLVFPTGWDDPYGYDNISDAPWFDASQPASARFYGVEIVELDGLGSTRRSVASLDGVADGQVFTSTRKLGRQAEFVVRLFGEDTEALEYGRAWLSAMLDGMRCGQDGAPCGLSTVEWFAKCPDGDGVEQRRQMLDTLCVEGPVEGDFVELSAVWMQEVSFTLASEHVGVFSRSRALQVSGSVGPSPIQEYTQNLIENPRGAGKLAAVEVGRNLVTNPSFETNTAGWLPDSDMEMFPVAPSFARVAPPSGFKGANGSYVGRIQQATTASNPINQLILESAKILSVQGNTDYRVSASFGFRMYNSDYREVFLFWLSASGAIIGEVELMWNEAHYATATNVFESLPLLQVRSPAGAASAFFRFRITRNRNVTFRAYTPQIWVDSVMVISGAVGGADPSLYPLPEMQGMQAYGSSPVREDLSFAWAGTAHASQTIIRRTPPSRWVPDTANASAGTLTVDGEAAVLLRKRNTTLFASPQMQLNNIVPGQVYFFGAERRGIAPVSYTSLRVRWINSAGDTLSYSDEFDNALVLSDSWRATSAGPVTAPAGAVRAAIEVVSIASTAQQILARRFRLNPLGAIPFFDGATPDTSQWQYSWDGTANASPSRRVPAPPGATPDPLADPACPPVPAPPRPPVVTDSCVADVASWSRFFYTIPADGIPDAISMAPRFTFTADRALDAARITVLPNPSGAPPEAVAGDEAAYWELTYLPASTPITVDVVRGDIYATIGGERIPAGHLVLGRSGQPVQWPTLSCGQGYVIVVETPYQATGGQIQPTVEVDGRVMFS